MEGGWRREEKKDTTKEAKVLGRNVVRVNIFITKGLIEISTAMPGYLSGKKEVGGGGKCYGNKDVKRK
jgi:hypothetical protein